jgi:antitoxin ParD1/3/4
MHISLTPELEAKVKAKVKSGLYNNASEVIREALRFMEQNQELLYQLQLDHLRAAVSIGAKQAEDDQFSDRSVKDIVADLNAKYHKS